jgi:hypothetical protein
MSVIGTQGFEQTGQFHGPKKSVDLGHFLFELVAVAVAQTTGHIKFVDMPRLFGIDASQYGIDRFLFGLLNKSTRIDYPNARALVGCAMGNGYISRL